MLNGQCYSYPTDIWSIGCALYEMASFNHPFIDQLKISTPDEIKGNYSPELKNLISQMLNKDANSRISLEEILSCTFLENYISPILSMVSSQLTLHQSHSISNNLQGSPRSSQNMNQKSSSLLMHAFQQVSSNSGISSEKRLPALNRKSYTSKLQVSQPPINPPHSYFPSLIQKWHPAPFLVSNSIMSKESSFPALKQESVK
jgi:serine/threonine protein kinase